MTSDAAPGRGGRSWWGRVFALLHPLLVSTTIASILLLLQLIPQLAPLDFLARAVASYLQVILYERQHGILWDRGYEVRWDPSAAGDRPLVIVAPNLPAQAEKVRMHPMQLAAGLILAAAREKPRVLAIALDLDPSLDDPLLNRPECGYPIVPLRDRRVTAAALAPCEVPGFDVATSRQYAAASLESRASLLLALEAAARDTTVVVAAPPLPLDERVFDNVVKYREPADAYLMVRRLAWTAQICETATMRVALRLPERDDSLSYERNVPSLGNLVWQTSLRARQKGDVHQPTFMTPIMDACESLRGPGGVQQIASVESARASVQGLSTVAGQPGRNLLGILAGRYYETRTHLGVAHVDNIRPGQPFDRMLPPGLGGQVVFLGDDSRLARVFHFNRVPEVDLHGAIYYSNLHAPVGFRHAAGFALEVVLGVALGLLFAWSWGAYAAAKARMDQVRATRIQDVPAKSRPYLRARGWLLWNLALLAGLIFGTLYAAHRLLQLDIWMNPIPLVIAMSLKGLLASRHMGAEEDAEDRWTYYNQHPDVMWQVPIILASLVAAWYSAH
jgi:hypothetical protein